MDFGGFGCFFLTKSVIKDVIYLQKTAWLQTQLLILGVIQPIALGNSFSSSVYFLPPEPGMFISCCFRLTFCIS